MPRCPRCHNIGLFVTHEVFDEDEESAWTEVRIGSDAGKHAARRLYAASEGGRLSGFFLTSTITRVSSLLQSPIPWAWQPATDYPSTFVKQTLCDQHQMREEVESAGSSKRREVDDRLINEKDPPPYGEQQREDALWKGEQPRCEIHWVTQQDTRRQ